MIAFVPDLMDRSRLGALTALEYVSSLDRVAEAREGETVIVDLARPGALDAAGAAARAGARVLGFVAHVDEAVMEASTSAGIEAMPRSQFFKRVLELTS